MEEKERREEKGRRVIADRRKSKNPDFEGPERRNSPDRRTGNDRRG